jgi:hypothetical protein
MTAMGAGIYYMYMPLIKTIKETEIIFLFTIYREN